MRKTILLITGLLAMTSCQKDYTDEFIAINEVNAAQATLIESLQEQINALVNALAEQTANLQEAIATNTDNIDANADAINLANQSIATNLTAIGQVSNTLSAEVINLFNAIESTETSLLDAIQERTEAMTIAMAEARTQELSDIAQAIALLRSEIAAAQATAIAYADANDSDTVYDDTDLAAQINTVSTTLASATAELHDRIDDLATSLEERVTEMTVAIQRGDDSNTASLTAAIETLREEIAAAQAAAEAYADANDTDTDTDTDTVYDDSFVLLVLNRQFEQLNLLESALRAGEDTIIGRVLRVDRSGNMTISVVGTTAKLRRFAATYIEGGATATFTARNNAGTAVSTTRASYFANPSIQQLTLRSNFSSDDYATGDVVRVTAE